MAGRKLASIILSGLPWWLSGKESICQCRRNRFDLWVEKIPWRKKCQPAPVFLLGKSHGQKSLVGYKDTGDRGQRIHGVTKESNKTLRLNTTLSLVYLPIWFSTYMEIIYHHCDLLTIYHLHHQRWALYTCSSSNILHLWSHDAGLLLPLPLTQIYMPPTLSTLPYSARQLLSCPCTVSVPLLQPMAHGTEPQQPLGHNCIRCLSNPTPFPRPNLLNLFGLSVQYNAPPHPSSLSSVQFSRSVMSDSLRPHELQHTRLPCPSPTPGVHSDSRPSSRWCHPAISSSVVHFSSCPQSLPASDSFPMSQLFTWGGQSTGAPPYSACFLISPTVVAPKVPYSGIHFTPFDFIWVHLYPHQNLGYNHGSNWNSSLEP